MRVMQPLRLRRARSRHDSIVCPSAVLHRTKQRSRIDAFGAADRLATLCADADRHFVTSRKREAHGDDSHRRKCRQGFHLAGVTFYRRAAPHRERSCTQAVSVVERPLVQARATLPVPIPRILHP